MTRRTRDRWTSPVTDPELDRPVTVADLRLFECRLYGDGRRPPPPHDAEAEHTIAERLLWGALRLEDLGELAGADFFFEDLGAIIEAGRAILELGGVPSIAVIAEVLERQGFRGDVTARLEAVRDLVPATHVRCLPPIVERVRALARQRRALEAILRAEEAIREREDIAAAAEHLARALSHVSPAEEPRP